MTVVPSGPSLSPLTTDYSKNTDPNYGTTYTHQATSATTNKLFGQPMISPRIGFNWDVKGDKSIIIRGGSGLFTGRIPFAWLGYSYYNNGVNYGAYDTKFSYSNAANSPKPGTDPLAGNNTALTFAQANGGTTKTQVDLVANNFKMPQVWRSSLAADVKLFRGYKMTLEGIFTKTIYDVMFQQINLKDSVTYNSYDRQHQQPIYLGSGNGQRINPNFSNAYMLSNTNQGYRYSLTAQLTKSYKFGLNVMAAYTYGKSFDITNGIRNSMESNWQLNPALNPNSPGLAYSNFDIRHRIVSSVMYKKEWNKKLTSYVSFIFTSQSGSPYTWGYVNATIQNTPQQVSLAYIPNKGAEELEYFNGNAAMAAKFDNFVDNDKYLSSRRGNFTERNGARTPWNNQLDCRLMQDVNFYAGAKEKKHTLQFTFDIINLTNLLNPNWGLSYFVPNTFNSMSSLGLANANKTVNGHQTYTFTQPTTNPYSVDQFASRFQCQVGARYMF